MRIFSHAPRAAALVAGMALAVGVALPASAATVQPNTKPTPATCPPGPYFDVVDNYGTTFADGSPEYTDYNGTSSTVSATVSNTWSGTVSSTISASISISLDDIVADASAQLSVSFTSSETITTGHSDTYTIPSHQYGHAEFGAWRYHLYVESYDVSGCSAYNYQYATAYLDDGIGWDIWTNTSS